MYLEEEDECLESVPALNRNPSYVPSVKIKRGMKSVLHSASFILKKGDDVIGFRNNIYCERT
jgi:hypothetical protein